MNSFFQDGYRKLVDSPNASEGWWHSMPLPSGDRINGAHSDKDLQLKMWKALKISNIGGLSGKRVLDIGANDGFFTLAALQAGAAEVTAVDVGWGTWPQNIEYASQLWNQSPSIITGNFLDFEFVRSFDVIFFFGVLYHLEDVFSCMKRLGELLETGGSLFVETQMSQIESDLPLFESASDIYPTIAPQDKAALSEVGVSCFLFPNEPAMRNLAHSYDFQLEALDGPHNLYTSENPSRRIFRLFR